MEIIFKIIHIQIVEKLNSHVIWYTATIGNIQYGTVLPHNSIMLLNTYNIYKNLSKQYWFWNITRFVVENKISDHDPIINIVDE